MTESSVTSNHQRDLPSGTVTILFTDIQGSTELLLKLDQGYVDLISDHHRLMREAFTPYGGTEVRTQGDSFFITFTSAKDAVSAAIDAQRAFSAHTWPEDVQVLVRMGLHTGEPWVAVEDYEGIDIHRAARIASTGSGGQVLLSETTTSLVQDGLPQGVSLKDLGTHRLKDMRRPEQIFQLVIPGLPSDFPPIRTIESLPTLTRWEAVRGYDLQQTLGKGVFGEVFRAYQPAVRREVAIKTILADYANDPSFIRRFEAEAQTVAALEHPYIVPLYDYWREPNGAYLVMRYLKGGSLEDALTFGPWKGEYAVRLVDQVASGLAYAHRQSVIHRDIKPANILLDEEGNAYLSDFGIATLAGSLQAQLELQVDDADKAYYTGSLGYQSPEVASGQTATRLADIYSLGVVLYQLVTAQRPFPGLSGEDLIEAHRSQPLPPVSKLHPELPPALDTVIQQATAKNPAERYQDAMQLAHAFKSAILAEEIAAPVEIPLEVENPYKGLRAFQEVDAAEFYGRSAMIDRIVGCLEAGGEDAPRGRFLAVVGPSGSGKSSLVRAGLVPALRKGAVPGSDRWFILDMIPGAHPYEELEAALLRVAVNPPASLLEQLRSDARGLVRAVKRCLPSDEDIELLLVVDQFEELFTLVQDPNESRRFLDCLYAAVMDPASRVRVVITLRADFYDRPLMHPDFSRLVQEHTEVVVPLTTEELSEAVEKPAQTVGAVLESGLTASIVADVHGEPGALPLLQYALTELFENRENGTLTQDAYHRIGGVLGALGKRAEDLYQGLDDTAATAARQLFLRLVTLGEGAVDTRRRVLLSEVEAISVPDNPHPTSTEDWSTAISAVINLYGVHRLFTFDRDPATRAPTLEVAHEALLREWSRLRGWLDESRADVRMQRVLGNAAAEWVAGGQDPSFLLRGARLEQYQGWAASTDLALTGVERTFLDASMEDEAMRTEERQKLERRSRNVLRALVAVFAVAAVVAVVLSLLALNAQHEAKISEQNALVQASIGLAAQAELELEGPFPERAVLLGLEALENYPHTWQAERTLGQIVRDFRLRRILNGHEGQVLDIAWSPNGDQIATTGFDGTLRLWDAEMFTQILSIKAHSGEMVDPGISIGAQDLAWSPDGTMIATASRDNTSKVWDAASGEEITEFSKHTDYISSVNWNSDGAMIASASLDGTARIWDSYTGEQLFIFNEHTEGINAVVWSPDDKKIATASDDGTSRVWNLESGNVDFLITEHDGAVLSVDWSPDGTKIASAGQDGTVRIWDFTSEEKINQLNLADSVWQALWSPDGSQIATASADGIARVWNPVTGEVIFNLQGLIEDQFNIAWSPDGAWLGTSAGPGFSARIWDASPTAITLPASGQNVWTYWSPDGTKIALAGSKLIGSGEGQASVWDFSKQEQLYSLEGNYGELNCIYWSPDGSRLSTAGFDGLGKIWDSKSGEELLTFTGHLADPPHPIFGIQAIWGGAWSPDSQLVVTAGGSGYARIWDGETGEESLVIVFSNALTSIPSWSPDGTRIAVSDKSHNLQVYDAETGDRLLGEPVENNEEMDFSMSTEWSPAGDQILTTGVTPGARVWDAETGEIISIFTEHTTWELASSWSPNGQRIATPDFSGVVKIWDAQTANELLSFNVPYWEYVYQVSWSPDGEWLAVGSQTDFVNIYPVWQTAEDLIDYTKDCCIVRELTAEEREQFGLPEVPVQSDGK